MRNAFVRSLHQIARKDERVFMLIADLGIFMFDDFKRDFPTRFVNVGVAEANMMGIAAGLALCQKVPFVYTIAPFVTMRCLEQIRVDVCYQNLNVKIVGIGGGLAYGVQGTTHHAIEDMAIMRALPNMTVISPSDPVEAGKATTAIAGHAGPVYLRLVREAEPRVSREDREFVIGEAPVLREGKDVAIVATGVMVSKSLAAAEQLGREDKIEVTVINAHTIKPLDKETILAAARRTRTVITAEEHSITGGLGSAVAEVIAEEAPGEVQFKRIGLRDTFCWDCGEHRYLQERYGLSEAHIAATVRDLLRKRH